MNRLILLLMAALVATFGSMAAVAYAESAEDVAPEPEAIAEAGEEAADDAMEEDAMEEDAMEEGAMEEGAMDHDAMMKDDEFYNNAKDEGGVATKKDIAQLVDSIDSVETIAYIGLVMGALALILALANINSIRKATADKGK